MSRNGWLALIVLAIAPCVSSGQLQTEQPERVEISDLLGSSGRYDGKMVMVSGEIRGGDYEDVQGGIFRLRGRDTLREIRIGLPRRSMDELRFLEGQRVVVTGTFWDLANQCFVGMGGVECYDARLREYGAVTRDFETEDKRYFIGIASVDPEEGEPILKEPELEEEEEPADLDVVPGELIDLRDLVKNPDPYLDKRVAVIGKFRGNNIYGDLSFRTKKTPRDFIIKVADAAIWVTGRRPTGRDFELNPRMRRDTGKWLKVTGVPWMEEGMVYVKAQRLELVPDPEDSALEPVEEPKEAEAVADTPPPEVTFSIPLDGEPAVPLDSEFRVQFSNDMNAASFDRNVDLLYGDDEGRGNPFPDMQIRYESAQRTLVVIAGDRLAPGKPVILILYNGITDNNGKRLVPTAADEEYPDAAVILRFFTSAR